MKPFSFNNRIVLLTGATGGLGQAMARLLSQEGAKLILTGRSFAGLQSFIETLPGSQRAVGIDADLTMPGEAARLAEEAMAVYERIDVLINNAGMGYFSLMEEAREDRIRQLFELNMFSPLILTKSVLPQFIERGQGRIINIASSAGRVPIPTAGIYGGSKSALAIMANTLRFEIEDKGVVVINIYPGTTNTAFEANALREKERDGIAPSAGFGKRVEKVATDIIMASRGGSREVWLEKEGRRMAAGAILWPGFVERRLKPFRNRVLKHEEKNKTGAQRRWRLLQVETSIACNLSCIMCPWQEIRRAQKDGGLMSSTVWKAISQHINEVASVDFSGGGEPLLNPALVDRVREAKAAGCEAGFLTNGTLLDESLCQRLLHADIDWIAFSLEGATDEVYRKIRKGGDFSKVTENIRRLTSMRQENGPTVLINFVMMPENIHQLEAIVDLAADLGADQLVFKQCDVSRGDAGAGLGLFETDDQAASRQHQKALKRARKRARRLKIKTADYSFVPDEQAVCDQDPRSSLFIRYDGVVAPCINHAYGGATLFLGNTAHMPQVHYGKLPEADLTSIWRSSECRFYRERFTKRVEAFTHTLGDLLEAEATAGGVREIIERSQEEMPSPPKGCESCHYLYGI